MPGKIVQISVSQGGVPKLPVAAAQVSVAGLSGDRQANLKFHGGPDRAVCLWSLEVIESLRQEGHAIAPGNAGENVTVTGLDWSEVKQGTQIHLGETVLLEVTDYAQPCRKNMRWFADRRFSRISQTHYPGSSRVYARVLVEGAIAPDDPVELAAKATASLET
ncbi:MAG: MOSC domain-containing protein [Cyanobacteria bacterium Co-bin8]|nr:MOSC domain-containing protein [Cyanobacteria bacterium Co-bin8]